MNPFSSIQIALFHETQAKRFVYQPSCNNLHWSPVRAAVRWVDCQLLSISCENLELHRWTPAVHTKHTLLELVNDQVSVLSHDVTCRVCDTLI